MSILKEILDHKRQEVASLKQSVPAAQLKDSPEFTRLCISLCGALQSRTPAVIAEIKKASPSKGLIRRDFDPAAIAKEYVTNGASAISVLTDNRFFSGQISFIRDIRSVVPLPILRKDFIIDSYQLIEAKAFGADSLLLIAAALEKEHLRDLYAEAAELGMECLVEVHNEHELETLDFSQVKIIGINNRDLSTFIVDPEISIRVASSIPKEIMVVSESGIFNRSDINRLSAHGIHAVLIGEHFMRADSPGEALRTLLQK